MFATLCRHNLCSELIYNFLKSTVFKLAGCRFQRTWAKASSNAVGLGPIVLQRSLFINFSLKNERSPVQLVTIMHITTECNFNIGVHRFQVVRNYFSWQRQWRQSNVNPLYWYSWCSIALISDFNCTLLSVLSCYLFLYRYSCEISPALQQEPVGLLMWGEWLEEWM